MMQSTGLVNLTQRAYVAVAAAIWNQKGTCCYLKKHFLNVEHKLSWSEVENYVLSCVDQLDLPNTLKPNLKGFILLIGDKVKHWFSMTESSFRVALANSDLPLNFHFVWAAAGTLDVIETAKCTINCNLSNKILCYSLASVFCIEEILSEPEASMHIKDAYKLCKSLPRAESLPSFLLFWIDTLNSNLAFETDVIDRNKSGCYLAREIRCFPVLKHFLDGLPLEYKKNMIRTIISREIIFPDKGNMLLFLFSHLEASEKNEMIKKHTFNVLVCFLEWPHQEYFMTVANTAWSYMSKSEFQGIFYEIAGRVSDFYPSNVYTNLIREFWSCSPAEFKADFINECVSGSVFRSLFLLRNTKGIIEMLFHECTAEQRQQIIFHPESMGICEVLVVHHRWDYLKLFVFSCIPSKEVMKRFSTQFQNRVESGFYEKEKELSIAAFIAKTNDWY